MIPFLIFLAVLCAVIGLMFWFYQRVHDRARRDLRAQIISFCSSNFDECNKLVGKRKGNNFNDQMYRAAMKGNADAYRSVADALRSIE